MIVGHKSLYLANLCVGVLEWVRGALKRSSIQSLADRIDRERILDFGTYQEPFNKFRKTEVYVWMSDIGSKIKSNIGSNIGSNIVWH